VMNKMMHRTGCGQNKISRFSFKFCKSINH
jgi:hypothetical protein